MNANLSGKSRHELYSVSWPGEPVEAEMLRVSRTISENEADGVGLEEEAVVRTLMEPLMALDLGRSGLN